MIKVELQFCKIGSNLNGNRNQSMGWLRVLISKDSLSFRAKKFCENIIAKTAHADFGNQSFENIVRALKAQKTFGEMCNEIIISLSCNTTFPAQS